MESVKPVRFFPGLDILLLREVMAVKPSTKANWDVVHLNVNTALKRMWPGFVTLRSCKDRLKSLQEANRRNEMASLRASGTDEDYDERMQLLTDLANEDEEKVPEGNEKQKQNEIKEHQGKDIRNATMATLVPKTTSSSNELEDEVNKPKKRRLNSSDAYVKYLQDKLDFDKQKFEVEKKERELKMEHDREMMWLMFAIIEKKN